MGFSVEERIAHAERVGDETAPSAGLQLNGRPWEIKTVGDDLRDILEKKRRNEPLGPKALEMSAGGCSVTVEKAPESAAALEEDGTSNAENGSVPSSDDINGTDSEELSAETHQLAEPEMPEANTAEGEPKYYCQNVFQQLHITTGGEVRPCCFWTGKTLGRLEERGIDEMWNDPYMVSVRQAILDGKIPKDCKTCHNLVPYDRSAIWADTHHEVVQALKR
jgi:radical SAM protein with 4Fe4S-binding SPASM domain